MQKIKKIINAVVILVGLAVALFKLLGNDSFNTLFIWLYLGCGVFLLALEIVRKEINNPLVRITLIIIPALMVALALQNLLSGTYSFTAIIISLLMYFMLSERYALSPKKS